MVKETRRRFSSEQKAEAVRRHVMGKEAVSDICESMSITPNQFYRWQQELFSNAEAAFEVKKRGPKRKSREAALESKIEALEQKLNHKDTVIAEVVEECVKTKKKLGLS